MSMVSVIIPVYNADLYIKKCLDSLIAQTFHDYEIIIINDGSTDQTLSICEFYAKEDNRIKIISQLNKGQAIARNLGVEKAIGEFICFVDSDDFVDKRFIEILLQKQYETNADIVWCDAIAIKDKMEIKLSVSKINSNSNVKEYILNNTGPWRKLIRKGIITNHNLFFPSLRSYEDIAVVPLYGMHTNKIVYVDKPLYYYYMHDGSVMHQLTYDKKLESVFESMDNLYREFEKTGKLKEYVDEIEYLYIEHLLHAASLRFFTFFNETKSSLIKISEIMKVRFPHWKENPYFKKTDWKYKVICLLFYYKQYKILKKIL